MTSVGMLRQELVNMKKTREELLAERVDHLLAEIQRLNTSPKEMGKPANVTISKDRAGWKCSAAGLPGQDLPGGRKLFPGEVVTVDLDWPEMQHRFARPEHAQVLEVTTKPANRPVIFPSEDMALWTSPGLASAQKAHGAHRVEENRELLRQLMAEYNKEFDDRGGAASGVLALQDEEVQTKIHEAKKKRPASVTMAGRPKMDPRDTLSAPRGERQKT